MLNKNLSEVLHATFPKADITSIEKLNNGEDIFVCRIFYTSHQGGEFTAIAKFINCECSDKFSIETLTKFQVEKANYQFISKIDGFSSCPKLYSHSDSSILIEDLGDDDYNYLDETELYESIATTLSELHVYTSDKLYEYKLIFENKDFIADETAVEDNQYSHFQCNYFYDIGINTVLFLSEKLDLETNKLKEEFSVIRQRVNTPTFYEALIHGDIHSRRQTVTRNEGEFCLLDFEQSRYSHSLLDISFLMQGKFDWSKKQSEYFLNNPNFSKDFVNLYKAKRKKLGGIGMVKDWNFELSAAYIYVALVNIGILEYLTEKHCSSTSANEWFAMIVDRLIYLTDGYNNFTEVERILSLCRENLDFNDSEAIPS